MARAKLMQIIIVTLGGVLAAGAAAAQTCVENLRYRVPITIDNTGNPAELSDFEVELTLDTAALIAAGYMNSDGSDLRFSDGSGCLPYTIESGLDTAATTIWTRVSVIPAATTSTIYLHMGDATAVPGDAADATFSFYEGFDDATIRLSAACGSGTATVSGGLLDLSWGSSYILISDVTLPTTGVYIGEMEVAGASGNWPGIYWIRNDNYKGYGLLLGSGSARISKTSSTPSDFCAGHNWASSLFSYSGTAGRWQTVWVADGDIRASFPTVGAITSTDTEHVRGGELRLTIGGISSGAGSVQTDWIRARKIAETSPGATAGAPEDVTGDLALAVVDSVDPAVVGSPITYTVTTENAGGEPAADVLVDVALPVGSALQSATGDFHCWSGGADALRCALGAAPSVLLVDDDDNLPDVRPAYEAAFAAMGLVPAVFDVGGADGAGPDAATMAGYDLVVWFSGGKVSHAGPSPADEAELDAYLGAGGALVLSSQDYLAAAGGVTGFASARLGVAMASQDIPDDPPLAGTSILRASGALATSYPFTATPDALTPNAAGARVIHDGGTDAVDVVGLVAADRSAAFLAFPWEAVHAADAAVGTDLMARVVAAVTGPSLPPAGTANLAISTALATAGLNTLSASVETSRAEVNLANNAVSESTTATLLADLSASVVAMPPATLPGGSYTFVVTVDNLGPSPVGDATVGTTLPNGFTVTSTSGCAEDPLGVPTCTLGAIAGGGSAAFSLTVVTDAGIAIGQHATVFAASSSAPDSATANNTAVATTTVIDPATVIFFDGFESGDANLWSAVVGMP